MITVATNRVRIKFWCECGIEFCYPQTEIMTIRIPQIGGQIPDRICACGRTMKTTVIVDD